MRGRIQKNSSLTERNQCKDEQCVAQVEINELHGWELEELNNFFSKKIVSGTRIRLLILIMDEFSVHLDTQCARNFCVLTVLLLSHC